MIISFILVTLMYDSEVILQGEIRCWSLSGFKGLIIEVNYFCQCLIVQSLFFVQVAYLYCSTSAGGHVCTLSRLLSVGFFLVTPTCLRARGKH